MPEDHVRVPRGQHAAQSFLQMIGAQCGTHGGTAEWNGRMVAVEVGGSLDPGQRVTFCLLLEMALVTERSVVEMQSACLSRFRTKFTGKAGHLPLHTSEASAILSLTSAPPTPHSSPPSLLRPAFAPHTLPLSESSGCQILIFLDSLATYTGILPQTPDSISFP